MSAHTTHQGMLFHSHSGLLCHCGLILGIKEWQWCAWTDLHLKKRKRKKEQAGSDSSSLTPHPPIFACEEKATPQTTLQCKHACSKDSQSLRRRREFERASSDCIPVVCKPLQRSLKYFNFTTVLGDVLPRTDLNFPINRLQDLLLSWDVTKNRNSAADFVPSSSHTPSPLPRFPPLSKRSVRLRGMTQVRTRAKSYRYVPIITVVGVERKLQLTFIIFRAFQLWAFDATSRWQF